MHYLSPHRQKGIISSFITPAFHSANACITNPFHSGNATFHYGFIHFSHNCICTQAFNSFCRYCSLFHCGYLCCPLILCHLHTDTPTARAQNNASPLPGFFQRTNNLFIYFIPKLSYLMFLSCFLTAKLLQAKLLHFV